MKIKIGSIFLFWLLLRQITLLATGMSFGFAANGKVSGPNSSLLRKWRLMRRIGKLRKAEKNIEKNRIKEKRKEERAWKKYKRRRKFRWILKRLFRRKRKDKSDQERRDAWALEKQWRKEKRHWNWVRRRRIMRLVIKNAFKKKKPAPIIKQKIVVEAVVEEERPVLNTYEEVVDASEIRRMEREERRWNRYKRRRLLKYIIKRTIQKAFEKKTVEEKSARKEDKKFRRNRERFERRKRRRLLRYVMKKRWQRFLYYWRHFPSEPIKQFNQRFQSAKISRDQFIVIIINSTLYFVLSYVVLFILQQLLTALFALHFDFQSILYYWGVYYNIAVEAWSFDSVKILYSIPAISSLILGILYFILYNVVRYENGHLKLFVLWSIFHCFVQFSADFLFGPILEKGFGYVLMYLYFLDTKRMITVIISLFFLLSSGVLLTKSFLISANIYVNELTQHNRRLFMNAQVLIPYILGSAFIILIKLPEVHFYEILLILGGILAIAPIMFTFSTFNEMYFDQEPRRIRVFLKLLLITVAFIIVWRIATDFGIRIGTPAAELLHY